MRGTCFPGRSHAPRFKYKETEAQKGEVAPRATLCSSPRRDVSTGTGNWYWQVAAGYFTLLGSVRPTITPNQVYNAQRSHLRPYRQGTRPRAPAQPGPRKSSARATPPVRGLQRGHTPSACSQVPLAWAIPALSAPNPSGRSSHQQTSPLGVGSQLPRVQGRGRAPSLQPLGSLISSSGPALSSSGTSSQRAARAGMEPGAVATGNASLC